MDKRPQYLIPGESRILAPDWPLKLFGDLVPYAMSFKKGDRAAAEDLAQRAVIRAERHLTTLPDVRNIRAWFRRVLNNLAIDDARKEQRERAAILRSESLRAEDGSSASALPEPFRLPAERPWFMSLAGKAPESLQAMALALDVNGWDNVRTAEYLAGTRVFEGEPLEKLKHRVRRERQRLEDWMWAFIGLMPEVRAHVAYDRDPLYKGFNMLGWREMLGAQAGLIAHPDAPGKWDETKVDYWRTYRSRDRGWDCFLWSFIEVDMVLVEDPQDIPHFKARACEFQALDYYHWAMRGRRNFFQDKPDLFQQALEKAEESLDLFRREGLAAHFARISDHYQRIETLVREGGSARDE